MIRSSLNFTVLLFGIVVSRTGWFVTIPFMAVYLYKVLHISPISIGLVLGVGPLASSIVGIFGGVFSDQHGNKFVMVSSLFLSSMFFLLFTFTQNVMIFGLLNILLGVLRAFFEVASKSYIVDIIPVSQRLKAFGWRYAAINLGGAVGPAIASLLFNASACYIFYAASFSYLAAAFLYLFTLRRFSPNKIDISYWSQTKQSLSDIFHNKPVILLSISGVIIFSALTQLDSTLPQVLATKIFDYLSIYSFLLIANSVVVVAFQPFFNNVIDRLGHKRGLYISIGICSLAFIFLAFAVNGYEFFIGVVLLSIGETLNVNLSSMLVDMLSPQHMKGAYFGVANINFLGYSLGPFLGSIGLQYIGSCASYVVLALILAFSYFLYKPSINYLENVNLPIFKNENLNMDARVVDNSTA